MTTQTNQRRGSYSRLSTVSTLTLLGAIGTYQFPAALAQSGEPILEEITVTGSRISRSGFTTPTPVSTVDSERMNQLGISNVGEALNQLPAFRPTTTPTMGGLESGPALFLADLRGLGANRTLLLVNNRRFIPTTAQGAVDLNLIPSVMISRSEVVTGGASAAYGSDAVAGVVNILLDTEMEGFRSQLEYGISDQDDNENWQFSMAGGSSFAGGRGHLVGGFEYADNKGTGDCYSRDWCAQEWLDIADSNPNDDIPAHNILPHGHTSSMTPGGLIMGGFTGADGSMPVNDPLLSRQVQFGHDGQPRPFETGNLPGLFYMNGGSGHGSNAFLTGPRISGVYERYSTFGHASFELTRDVEAFVEASYGLVKADTIGAQTRDLALGGIIVPIKVYADNPFLPESITDYMAANNYTALNIGRAGNDLGNTRGEQERSTWRIATGLDGILSDGWTWDVYYQYGETKNDSIVHNNRIEANFQRAIDATTNASGQPVGRSGLSVDPAVRAAAAGCQPLNIIGEYNWSPEAKDYAYGTSWSTTEQTQHVAAVNLSGEVFQNWAGPVSVATGVEYRRDLLSRVTDPTSNSGGFYQNAGTSLEESTVNVHEGYVETVVPLLYDKVFAQAVEFNGAVRYTDYSSSGGVTTWKAGLSWEVNDKVRLRGTRSRDIRAPNLNELYAAQATGLTQVTDPTNGIASFVPVLGGGNPNLQHEEADTWTVGIVLQPEWSFLNNMRFSMDYFDIEIADAIGTFGAQNVVNRCAEGANEFCQYITRTGGVVTGVQNTLLNVNGRETSGIDFELDYFTPVGNLGDLNFRLLATWVDEYVYIDAGGSVDKSGQTGRPIQTPEGIPDWVFDGMVTFTSGDLSVTTHGKYIPSGLYDSTLVGPDKSYYDPSSPYSINDNTVSSRFYVDLSAQYKLFESANGRNAQVYGRIANLFDRDPPVAPGAAGASNLQVFDGIGRTYKVGMRYNF